MTMIFSNGYLIEIFQQNMFFDTVLYIHTYYVSIIIVV